MGIACILVHYHGADLAARAVAALEADLAAAGLRAELLLVDNGSDEDERAALHRLPIRYLDAGDNLGYAGGINLGVRSTAAELLVLMNPDVLVLPGCLPTLLAELDSGAAAAGPRFYWDRGRRFLLPPTEETSRRAELLARLAEHGDRCAALARRRWRRRARRFWSRDRPFPTPALSGALLAVRRDALDRVGPFDECYRLYFEESDWLLRLRRAGLVSRHVPAAGAVHLFNQSAAGEPAAGRWFAESQRRFRRHQYGAWFSGLLAALPAPRAGRPTLPAPATGSPPGVRLPETRNGRDWPLWVEISALPRRFPAAATRLADDGQQEWALPAEIWSALAPGRYFLTVCNRLGRELLELTFERPADR